MISPVSPLTLASDPLGPVGPTGPRIAWLWKLFDVRSIESSIISCLNTASSIPRVLALVCSTSVRLPAPPLNPGNVPSANCIFSPSLLITWANPSSFIAIDANIRLTTSARSIEITGVMFGTFGVDKFLSSLAF
jgi:hypothetical protein